MWQETWNEETLAPWKKSYDKPRRHIKNQRLCLAGRDAQSQSYGFSSSHIWLWELDHKEGWAPKNWCFWIMVLEKTLESPLAIKEIKLVNPKGNQPWILIERTDAEAEDSILWSPDAKSQLTGKDSDAGKNCGQEKGMTEGEMVGWHHWLNGPELEQTLGDREDWCAAVHGIANSRTQLSDWTTYTLNKSHNMGLVPNKQNT